MKKLNLIKLLTLVITPIIVAFALGLTSLATETGAKKPTILEFSSPMCSACNQLKQVLPGIEAKYASQIEIKKYNVASTDPVTQQLASTHNVKVVPTLVFIDKNGNVVRSTKGCLTESQLNSYFKELINK